MKKKFLRRSLSLLLSLFVMLTALPIEAIAEYYIDFGDREVC